MSEQQPQSEKSVEKEKFTAPVDPTVQAAVDSALGDVNLDSLYGFDKAGDQNPTTNLKIRGMQAGSVQRIDVAKDEVLVELTGKMQGIARFSQFLTEPKLRDVVEVNVERFDGREGLYICTPKGAASQNTDWDSLSVGSIVEGVVNGMNKGGLEVKVGNLRAFMPSGQIDVEFHKDISVFLAQKMQVEVTQIERESKRLVVSRRKILERERGQKRDEMLKVIAEGQTLTGTVRNVMDFGAFVDLGGLDGLIHISEMTYNRHAKPSDVVKVGDKVEVKVIKFDKETGKVGLSLKASMQDPWKDVETKYPVGEKVTARVVKIESFGAFIEVEEGIQGLLPLSEMSWQRIRHPGTVVQVGQTIPLVVIAVDATNRKMTFSLKQATGDPWSDAAAQFPKHSLHEGKVARLAEFGAFIELAPNVDGLVHISEMSDKRIRVPGDVVKVGDMVKVRVLDTDIANRRISLSMKNADASFVPPPEPVKKPEKKRKIPLRGGLDF
jgi:small subunit ribosomal protein S1